MASGRVQAYYWTNRPPDSVVDAFKSLLRSSLVIGAPEDVRVRALEGPTEVVMRSLDGKGGDAAQRGAGFLIPMALGLFFMFAIMSTAGYLLQAVTDEKENRTVEVMATSVSANQLIGGKTAGLVAVALTQVFVWVAVGALGLAGGRPVPGAAARGTRVGHVPRHHGPLLRTLLHSGGGHHGGAGGGGDRFPAGAADIRGDSRSSSCCPLFLLALVFGNPDSPVLVFFSLFPTTSFSMVAFRWGATAIPFWQLAAGWVHPGALARRPWWSSLRASSGGACCATANT